MKLFLTSQASETLHLLVPYLAKKPEDIHVVVIATASNLYADHPWLDKDLAKLVELEFNVSCIDIATLSSDELQVKLNNADMIFVAGGNTSYLLDQSHKSGFFNSIKNLVQGDIWYVGSSAGSVIAGPNLEYDRLYDEGEFSKVLDSYEGFHFVEFIPVPHADSEEHKPYIEKAFEEYGARFDMRKLTDKQAYLVLDNDVQLVEA